MILIMRDTRTIAVNTMKDTPKMILTIRITIDNFKSPADAGLLFFTF